MKTLLLVLALLGSPFAQVQTAGGVTFNGGARINAAPGSTTIADWTGIDAMSPGTISQASDTQIGTTAWFWNRSANSGLQIVAYTDPTCGLIKTSGNCAVFTHDTSLGNDNFPSYLYLETTASTWATAARNYNEFLDNGANFNGGIWFQYKVVLDSNTSTYLSNTTAQIKVLLNRNGTSGGLGQANTGAIPDCSWAMHILGIGSGDGIKNMRYVSDCGSAFARAQQSAAETAGITVKCQYRRDAVTSRGSVRCSTNGTEIVNCDTGTQCTIANTHFLGGNASAASNAGRWAFHIGMRYFAACTNACSNTTAKLYIADVKVCDYNCISYP
jgi:hypothetical protein